MRPTLVIILTCLTLAACGSTEHKTVIVNPPAGSTTVVDQDGHAHTVPNN
jgi:predicted small lipoprotein YifL